MIGLQNKLPPTEQRKTNFLHALQRLALVATDRGQPDKKHELPDIAREASYADGKEFTVDYGVWPRLANRLGFGLEERDYLIAQRKAYLAPGGVAKIIIGDLVEEGLVLRSEMEFNSREHPYGTQPNQDRGLYSLIERP